MANQSHSNNRCRQLADAFYHLGINSTTGEPPREELAKLSRESGNNQRLQAVARDQFRKGWACRQRLRSHRSEEEIEPGAEHRLWRLLPSPRWRVYIDESGSLFDSDEIEGARPSGIGVLAAVFVPESVELPPLPKGFHCSYIEDAAIIDHWWKTLLDQPVGILGVKADGLARTMADGWLVGVTELVEWGLRLLPIEGKTQVRFFPENRGVFQGAFDVEPVVKRLSPVRAENLTVTWTAVAKDTDDIQGYADLVAFSWHSPCMSKRRLESGLVDVCLYERNISHLMHLCDIIASENRVHPDDWEKLLRSVRHNIDNIPKLLAERLLVRCRREPEMWRLFLDKAREHLHGKQIRLDEVGLALGWLDACRPTDAEMDKRDRLVLLSCQLADSNHHGGRRPELAKKVEELGAELRREFPDLVCHAIMHCCVSCTDRLDIDAAEELLASWQKGGTGAGLKMDSIVLSQAGQIAAFRRDNAEAIRCFDAALTGFRDLSNKEEMIRELSQTGVYRVIAMLDDPETNLDAKRKAVEGLSGGDTIRSAILKTAGSDIIGEQYRHHVLLRYLCLFGVEEERKIYVLQRPRWQARKHHPWELIALYRAILLWKAGEQEAAREQIESCRYLTGGKVAPILRLIGSAIMAVGYAWGMKWEDKEEVLASIEADMSTTAAADAVAAIRSGVDTDDPALWLSKTMLFNYR